METLAIDPVDSDTLYAGTCDFGMFKSTDAGGHWTAIGDSWPDLILSIAYDPTDPRMVYAGTDYGLLRTSDAGASWTSSETPAIAALAIDARDHRIIYAGSWSGAFKSVDAGVTWVQMMGGLPRAAKISDFAIDPSDPGVIYAAGRRTVYESSDGGSTWTSQSEDIKNATPLQRDRPGALSIDPADPRVLYAGTTAGVFKSVDGAANWDRLDAGPDRYVDSLAISHDDLHPSSLERSLVFIQRRPAVNRGTSSNDGIQGVSVSTIAVGTSGTETTWAAADGAVYTSANGKGRIVGAPAHRRGRPSRFRADQSGLVRGDHLLLRRWRHLSLD